MSLNRNLLTVTKRFKIFRLNHDIMVFNLKSNKYSYSRKLQLENVINVEETMETIKSNIQKILKLNINIWMVLYEENIDQTLFFE